jgi:acetylornithine deacetylase
MDHTLQQQILAHVDQAAMIVLASALIRIPSFKTEETPAARFLADFFRSQGYQVDLQEIESGRFQTIATLKGTGGGASLMWWQRFYGQGMERSRFFALSC